MANKNTAIATQGTIAFGERSVSMGHDLFGLLNIPTDKSYYATAQNIVQSANGVAMAADINRLQCQLFADALGNPEVIKDYKTMEDFIKALDIPQFFKRDKGGETKFAKSTVSQMCAAGIVYNDNNAPESLKARPWSVLGAMGKILRNADERAILYSAINGGELTITTQDDARAYAKKRADAHKRNKDSADSADSTDSADSADSADKTDSEENAEHPTMYLLEICTDGVFHASYEADADGLVVFGKSVEDVHTALAGMASTMISDANFTSAVPLPDGRSYGAIVSASGDATIYRLTEVEQKSIQMPPASQIKGLREARDAMLRAGMKVDPQYDLMLSVADMLNW